MLASSDKLFVLAMVAVVWLPMAGCKRASPGNSPDSATEFAQEPSPEPSQDPLAELDALEDRMRALDLPVARARAQAEGAVSDGDEADLEAMAEHEPAPTETAARPPAPTRDQPQRCTDLCDLSVAICDLEDRICALSDSHAGESIYVDACYRASDDCDVADDACTRCAG